MQRHNVCHLCFVSVWCEWKFFAVFFVCCRAGCLSSCQIRCFGLSCVRSSTWSTRQRCKVIEVCRRRTWYFWLKKPSAAPATTLMTTGAWLWPGHSLTGLETASFLLMILFVSIHAHSWRVFHISVLAWKYRFLSCCTSCIFKTPAGKVQLVIWTTYLFFMKGFTIALLFIHRNISCSICSSSRGLINLSLI